MGRAGLRVAGRRAAAAVRRRLSLDATAWSGGAAAAARPGVPRVAAARGSPTREPRANAGLRGPATGFRGGHGEVRLSFTGGDGTSAGQSGCEGIGRCGMSGRCSRRRSEARGEWSEARGRDVENETVITGIRERNFAPEIF